MTTSPGELVADWPERAPLITDGDHNRAVILQPADEEVANHNPEECREPAKLNGNERTKDRTKRSNALELIAPENILTDGKVLDPISVHMCRCGTIAIRLPDPAVIPLSIHPVRNKVTNQRRQNKPEW